MEDRHKDEKQEGEARHSTLQAWTWNQLFSGQRTIADTKAPLNERQRKVLHNTVSS